MDLDYGVQLYSIRDFMGFDIDHAFRWLHDFGYKTVEFAGFYDHTAEQINELLAKHELKVRAAHIGLDELAPDKIEETIEFHKKIGNNDLVIPSIDFNTDKRLYKSVAEINRVAPIVRENGMKLHFHTHDFDYEPNMDGSLSADVVEKETDVLFEIDTFWAFYAGRDPLAEMERLRDRVELVHIKDGAKNRDPRVLGQGIASVADCVKKAQELGFYMIVESEGMIPDGLTDVKHSLKFLKKLAAGEIAQ